MLEKDQFFVQDISYQFSPGWLMIRECVFSFASYDNVRSVFWNSFTWKGFPETNQAVSVDEFSTINEWTILFGLIRIYFSCGSSTGSLTQRFKSSGYHDCVLQTGAITIKSRTHSCFILGALLKSYRKWKMDTEDPYSNFCFIVSVLWL